ncbi:GspH/FimT family pseudopilin [bacterium]|nr:GspH/FimT family pseudopilin [bacterium]
MEALVVIGLIALIVAIFMPSFFRILHAYTVQTTAQQVAIQLRFARNAAVKQKANYKITVRDETAGTNPNTYFFERDPERDGSYETFKGMDVSIPNSILIKSGSISQIEFDSRGRASTSGVIRLEGKYQVRFEISVSLNGSVSTKRI